MNNTVPVDLDLERLLVLPGEHAEQQQGSEPEERHLRLVPAASKQAKAKRAGLSPLLGSLIAVGIVLAIFAGKLGLSIAISQGAYEARALSIEERDLSRVERVLSQNVDRLASPQNLAENAISLGMVQNTNPATLRLSDGAILGSLDSVTTEAQANLVSNATLESMPMVDADGLLVSRSEGLAATRGALPAEPPVRWQGKLPAPDTH